MFDAKSRQDTMNQMSDKVRRPIGLEQLISFNHQGKGNRHIRP
jgi:hypothetical protein